MHQRPVRGRRHIWSTLLACMACVLLLPVGLQAADAVFFPALPMHTTGYAMWHETQPAPEIDDYWKEAAAEDALVHLTAALMRLPVTPDTTIGELVSAHPPLAAELFDALRRNGTSPGGRFLAPGFCKLSLTIKRVGNLARLLASYLVEDRFPVAASTPGTEKSARRSGEGSWRPRRIRIVAPVPRDRLRPRGSGKFLVPYPALGCEGEKALQNLLQRRVALALTREDVSFECEGRVVVTGRTPTRSPDGETDILLIRARGLGGASGLGVILGTEDARRLSATLHECESSARSRRAKIPLEVCFESVPVLRTGNRQKATRAR